MSITSTAKPTAESSFAETKSYLERLRDSGETLPIRDLIGFWGQKGRGKNNISMIGNDLARMSLRADPPIDSGSLDTQVSVTRVTDDVVAQAEADRPADHLLTLARILSATFALRLGEAGAVAGFVTKDTPIPDAVTLMMRHDFSQLPVVDNVARRIVVGVFTWEGYGQARLRGVVPQTVGDAMSAVSPVDLHSDLFASVSPVTDNGFVVVTYRSMLSGIVTASDLTLELGELALPFLAVGRCERELKRVARSVFAQPLAKMKKPLDDLSFGGIQDLYTHQWDLLGWSLSKDQFVAWLDTTRKLRNSIAHFDDEQDTDLKGGIDSVHRLTHWLAGVQTAEASRASEETGKSASK